MGSVCSKCGEEPTFQDSQQQLLQIEDMDTVFGISLLDLRPLSYYEHLISADPSQRINYIGYIVTCTKLNFDYLFPADQCWFYLQKLRIIDNRRGYEHYWLEARILTKENNYDRAIARITKSQSMKAFFRQNYQLLCDIYEQLKKPTNLQNILLRYLKIYPGDLFIIDLLAQYAYKFQHRIIKRMIRKHSALDAPVFLPNLCIYFQRTGDLEGMAEYINKHIKRNQKFAWHFQILISLMQLNDPAKVVQHLAMLRQKQKDYYYVGNNIVLGKYSFKLGDRTMGEIIIKQIQQILYTISTKNVAKFLELLAEAGNYKKVTEIYESILEPRMSDLSLDSMRQAEFCMALSYFSLGEKEKSSNFVKILQTYAETTEVMSGFILMRYIELHLKLLNFPKAKAYYRRLKEQNDRLAALGYIWQRRYYEKQPWHQLFRMEEAQFYQD